MKRWTWGLAFGVVLALAGSAWAVTTEDVIGLTRAGASDTIILSKIEADGTVFHLTVDEILDLKKAGVSDPVITYMINTGKGDREEPAAVAEDEGSSAVFGEQESYTTEDSDRYSTGLDSQYRGTTTVAFAYYYPNWPGYRWSYYYDPFWWPDLAYYFTYWQPYPYGYWYYDPWYRCHARSDWYWGHGQYDYYAYAHHDSHERYKKGRSVGSRGAAEGYERSTKDRSVARPSYDASRRELRPTPATGETIRQVKPSRPGAESTRDLRQPRRPSPPTGKVDSPKPTPGRELKPTPQQSDQRQARPGADGGRTMKPTPAPSVRPQPSARPAPTARPAPGNTREESRARKH